MDDTATAIRDPIFFRWHKFIDDLFVRHKNKLTPYSADDLSFNPVCLEEIYVQVNKKNKQRKKQKQNKNKNNNNNNNNQSLNSRQQLNQSHCRYYLSIFLFPFLHVIMFQVKIIFYFSDLKLCRV